MPHVFPTVNIYSKIMKITYSKKKVCLQTVFFHKVFVHFYSLGPMTNKGVYALLVPFLVLLLFVSGSK
jgi:hypothetical protein